MVAGVAAVIPPGTMVVSPGTRVVTGPGVVTDDVVIIE
jgi:hypothetical protein